MATVTLADFLEQLGNIPTARILFNPPPGTATEEDLLEVERRTGLAPELIDGVLVEKTVGYKESLLAIELAALLLEFVRSHKLGIVLGPDGTLRILPDQIRLPDVCFISRDRFPGGMLPNVPVPRIAPDLAVEILSPGNTRGEMRRKLLESFRSRACHWCGILIRMTSPSAFTPPRASDDAGRGGCS